jgi:hypothetical protein
MIELKRRANGNSNNSEQNQNAVELWEHFKLTNIDVVAGVSFFIETFLLIYQIIS